MTKKKARVSGTQMKDSKSCAFAMPTQEYWQMDIGAVQQRIDAYLKEAAGTGKYSISGLCIALDIPRGLLSIWREGYANEMDVVDAGVLPNIDLSRCVEMALLHIQRYWEERDKPSSMDIKQLEAMGALGESASVCAPTAFDLGRLKKYAQ